MPDARAVVMTADPPPGRCRIDVWLWRIRLFRTRSLASRFVEGGLIRLTRQGQQMRIDKPSRLLMAGDDLMFARDGRLFSLRVEALGDRRGPPAEARQLYSSWGVSKGADQQTCKLDDADQR